MNMAIGTNRSFNYTPTADVAAGDIVIAGGLVGIAPFSIRAGETGVVDRFRAVEVPYDGAAAANLGATAYWNASGKKVTATASGNTEIGHFGAAVKSGAATCVVLLK